MGLFLLIAAVLLIDLGIKDTIEREDPSVFPKELEGTRGMIMLHRDHNDGLPFGILRQKKELVKQLPLAVVSAVAGIFAWIYPKKGNMPEKIGLALVIGGGLSNLYDRMTRGYVVDYVSIRWKKLKEVTFNLADVCVILGAFLLLIVEMFQSVREK